MNLNLEKDLAKKYSFKLKKLIKSNWKMVVGVFVGIIVAGSLGVYAQVSNERKVETSPAEQVASQTSSVNEEQQVSTDGATQSEPDQKKKTDQSDKKPSSGQEQKAKQLCVLLDGNYYCPVTNQQLVTFYYEPIQRSVPINTYGTTASRLVLGEKIDLEYESSDCTGTPYLAYFDDGGYKNKIYNNLLTAGYNDRYKASSGSAPLTISRGSTGSFNFNSQSKVCDDGGGVSKEVIALSRVNIPVSDPVKTPFQFDYR